MKINQTSFVVFADQIVFSGSNFLCTILLARIFSIENFGIISMVLFIALSISSVINSFIINPFQVLFAQVEEIKAYISFNFWLQLASTILIGLGVFLVFNFNIAYFHSLQLYKFHILIFIMAYLFYDFLRKLFIATEKITHIFFIDSLVAVFQIITCMFWYFLATHSIFSFLVFFGISYFLPFIIGTILLQPNFKHLNYYKKWFILHVQNGKWLLLTTCTQWLSSNIFILSTSMFIGINAFAAFRLVQSVFGVFSIIFQTFENAVLPKAVKLHSISSSDSKLFIKTSTNNFLIGVLIILFAMFIFSEQIMFLAGGSEYLSYHGLVKGMCILYLLIFVGYPIRIAIRMLLLNNHFFIGYVLALIVSVISFNYLMKEFSIYGAIIGLAISQLVCILYWNFVLLKKKYRIW